MYHSGPSRPSRMRTCRLRAAAAWCRGNKHILAGGPGCFTYALPTATAHALPRARVPMPYRASETTYCISIERQK